MTGRKLSNMIAFNNSNKLRSLSLLLCQPLLLVLAVVAFAIPERIEHWIEPEQGRSKRHA
jgi:hypothetical protein